MLPNMVSSTLSRSGPLPPVRAGPRVGRDALRPAARMFQLASKHVPRYTGYVPGLKNTFGITFGDASQTMLDAVHNRDEGALQVSYSPTAPVRKLQCSRSLVGGPSMHGLVEPHARWAPPTSAGESRLRASDREPALHTHLQGSEVDTKGYYESLIRDDYKGLRVKTAWDPQRQGPPSVKVGNGSPHRLYSAISLGDRFFFNGPHMYQTTYTETSQCGVDKTSSLRMSPQQKEMTTDRLNGCTQLVRSPRTKSPQGHFGFAE